MTQEITRFEIAKLELRQGDALVVKCDEMLNQEQAKRIRATFEHYVPAGTKVIVLDRTLSLEVLQRNETADPDGKFGYRFREGK